jgi:hypothetical protein
VALLAAGAAMLGLGVVLGTVLGPVVHPRPAAPAVASRAIERPSTREEEVAAGEGGRPVIDDEGAAVPPPQQAALPVAPPPPPPPSVVQRTPGGRPAWQRFAVPARDTGGRPMVAVIIDDAGVDKKRTERALQLPGPLTISLMTYADGLEQFAGEARRRGHELMLHVPMEPLAKGVDPGPGALIEGLPSDEVRKRIVDDLNRLDGVVGINNHMGSKFTAYGPGMQVVMEELHRRGLLFVDSMTTDRSVGLAMAQHEGVPAAARNVFLDNAGDLMSVEGQLAKVEETARKRGTVIAIGHPRDATIAALASWLPTLHDKGMVLVPVTKVVEARMVETASVAHEEK